jgi:outer membrane protein OmpA-like peptidoglycan-associated protein
MFKVNFQLIFKHKNMRKFSLIIVGLLIIISPTLKAQINVSKTFNRASKEVKKSSDKKEAEEKAQAEQAEKERLQKELEKDYHLLSRFEEAEKVYEKVVKWEQYNLPVNSNDSYLQWEAFTKLEGKVIRYQYKVSPDNNSAYLLKMYKIKLENAGFDVVLAMDGEELGISSQTFYKEYYNSLGNSKFGFAFGTQGCRDHSLIVGKITKDGKTVFASIYMTAFDNTTLITQDIIEAEMIEEQKVIVTIFRGSSVNYDDEMGFDEFYVTTNVSPEGELTTKRIEGNIHHRFCYAPKDRSIKEIITNYEEAIKSKGGKILVSSSGKAFYKEFNKKRPDHGLTNYEWIQFGLYNNYYLSAIVPGDKTDHYVLILPAQVEKKLVYSLVIIETTAMEKGFVTADNIDMLNKGHIAIYDIHFETGKSEINERSAIALENIVEFLNIHAEKKYLIVGHTDNVGDFAANIKLSTDRANSIVNELIEKYGVNPTQLMPYGIGSASPVANNLTDEGKAKNRRVEIVEQ